jgi:hypothetical protein
VKYFQRFEQLAPRKQLAVLLLIGFTLLFLTTPLNLVRGYLLAEEGSTYLRYAQPLQTTQSLPSFLAR